MINELKQRRDIKIKFHGHICCRPSDETDLSTQRALRIYDPLTERNENEMISNRRVKIEI